LFDTFSPKVKKNLGEDKKMIRSILTRPLFFCKPTFVVKSLFAVKPNNRFRRNFSESVAEKKEFQQREFLGETNRKLNSLSFQLMETKKQIESVENTTSKQEKELQRLGRNQIGIVHDIEKLNNRTFSDLNFQLAEIEKKIESRDQGDPSPNDAIHFNNYQEIWKEIKELKKANQEQKLVNKDFLIGFVLVNVSVCLVSFGILTGK
jgi:septal ring factor EnvC (AmiA/AmiB activator)